ncbi:MAG: fused MFS/spermidine synthase [Anaerolineales bacterium]
MPKPSRVLLKRPVAARPRTGASGRRLVLFSVLFLVSGMAALVYQVIWVRLLEQYFGVTMMAVTLIVAAFMAGLGLGSLVGGRIAPRIRSALAAFGLVELGIGLFGVFSPTLISRVGIATAGSPYGIVFVFSFLLLLIPTFLMGMTLPLLSQGLIDRAEISGQVIGLLYGINTLGSAFGSLAAAYFLIGQFGLDGSAWVACFLNLSVAGSALALMRWERGLRQQKEEPPLRPAAQTVRWGYARILFASFLVGFIGLGYEMLWVRLLGVVNKNTVYGYPSMLAVFLFGLAVGGYYWGRKADGAADPVRLFVTIELGLALTAALTFLLLSAVLLNEPGASWLRTGFETIQRPPPPLIYAEAGRLTIYTGRLLRGLFEYFAPILVLVLPACLLMGGGLPVLDRIAIESPQVAGRRVGDIHLANILGSVFGTLVTSFVLLEFLGSELTFKVLIGLSLVFPLLYLTAVHPTRKQAAGLAFPVVLAIALLLILPGRAAFYTSLYETGTGARAIVRESGDSVLALSMHGQSDSPAWLWIGGQTNSMFPSAGRYENNALVCAGTSRPKRILVIGFGGGHTAALLASLPQAQEIVIVELMQDLAPFLEENIPMVTALLQDERVDYLVDDGRRYLYANPYLHFDLISIDPLRRFTAGHNSLYSTEALRLYQSHLTESGVLCLWQDEQHVIPSTVAHVFPYVDSFRDVTVAGNIPLRYDYAYMEAVAQTYLDNPLNAGIPELQEWVSPLNILSTYVRDRETILDEESGTPVLSDMRPWLEYYYLHPPERPSPARNEADFQDFLDRLEACDSSCRAAILSR